MPDACLAHKPGFAQTGVKFLYRFSASAEPRARGRAASGLLSWRGMLLVAILFRISLAVAAEPIPRTPVPEQPICDHALLVTHASRVFEDHGLIEATLDALVAEFKARRRPVVYLMNDEPGDESWMTADRAPDLAIVSRSGDHDLKIRSREITVAGGFFELCEASTVADAAGKRPLIVNYPMAATYTDPHFHRLPETQAQAIPELLARGRYLTLREVHDILGGERFAKAIRNGAKMLFDRPARIEVDGKVYGSRNATLVLRFQ